jgi:hypothetical protein
VGRLKNKGAKRFFVRREGFGHSHGYFVSFLSQNISFARILQILYTFRILITKCSRSCESSKYSLSHPTRAGRFADFVSPRFESCPVLKIKSPSISILGSFIFCARYRILDLPSRVLFHLASLVRKSLSNPVAREAVHELSRSKIISIIFVHDTGFEPVTFPTSRGRSTD